jgi:ankyrin repeat protein
MMGKIKTEPHFITAAILLVVTGSIFAQTTDFMELVKTGSSKDVRIAIRNGGDVNVHDAENGWTPLMYAARYNPDPEVLAILLKSGAKVNARATNGATPLMCAAENNTNPEVIYTLMKGGAHVNARADGWTALICAAGFNDNPEVIIALLKVGANAKLKDNTGRTAFDRAQFNDRLKGTEAYWALKKAAMD